MKTIFTLLALLATMAVSAKDFLDMPPEQRDALPVLNSKIFGHPGSKLEARTVGTVAI